MEDAPAMNGRCSRYEWKVLQLWMEDVPAMNGRCSKYEWKGLQGSVKQKSTSLVHWALDATGSKQKETVTKLILTSVGFTHPVAQTAT